MKHVKTALVITALGGVAVGVVATFALPRLGVLPAMAGGMMCGGMMGGGMMGGSGMRDMMRGMMGGALPPGTDPALLPEPRSEGARLLGRFCTQCHDLPGPGLHTAGEWPRVVERMKGHMAATGKFEPGETETAQIVGFLQRHGKERE